MKKGFTLIELLAVIVILAIILAIAIPSISAMIDNATKNSFEDGAKMLLKAIDYKLLENDAFNVASVNENTISGTLNLSNINYKKIIAAKIDGENHIIIVGKNKFDGYTAYGTYKNMTVVENNAFSLSFTDYLKSGLILYYDGICNGGAGIHNDNTSDNKAIWKDLSPNSNDGNLNNFGYTLTSGWGSKSLTFDGSNDTVGSINSLSNMSNYTMEIIFKSYEYRYSTIAMGPLDFKWRVSSQTPYWNLWDASSNPNSTFYTTLPSLNTIHSFSSTYDGKTANLYLEGALNNSLTSTFTPRSASNLTFGTSELVYGEIYAVRVYNRALTSDEIYYNYQIDKLRFEF